MRDKGRSDIHLGVNTLFHVPGDVGGTETYLREMLLAIVNEFPQLKITLFTQIDNDDVLRDLFRAYSQVTFSRLPFKAKIRPLRIVAEQFILPCVVGMSGVDVLWSPGYTAPFLSFCSQAVTVHDLQYKNHPDDLTWLERITLDILVKAACKRCETVIAVSEFSRSEIIKYRFAGTEKVHAVLEGVDPVFSSPIADTSIHDQVQDLVPLDKPFILCVAHSYPHKNIHLLIDAFNEIQERIPHNLVIVGKARLGENKVQEAVLRLKDTTRLFRLSDGVQFDVLRWLYQNAELFILPSSYEGFGLPVLEAMMSGTSVVCSKKGSIPEVGGKYVRYVDPLSDSELGEAIIAGLHEDDALREHHNESARIWAESFTWKKSAIETVSLLRMCGK